MDQPPGGGGEGGRARSSAVPFAWFGPALRRRGQARGRQARGSLGLRSAASPGPSSLGPASLAAASLGAILLGAVALGAACAPRGPVPSAATPSTSPPSARTAADGAAPDAGEVPPAHPEDAAASTWAAQTSSPRLAPPHDPALAPWLALCGEGDAALHEVARDVAVRRDRDGAPPDPEWTTYQLRRRGAPYLAPRVWSAELPASSDVQRDEVAQRLEAWARRRSRGILRCGVAEVAREDATSVLAVVQVDVQGELGALPSQVAPGQWLEVRTKLLVATTDVAALVLGPQGPPRPVALNLQGDEWRGRFTVDQPGTWQLQLLANGEGGALPILEAYVHAGAAPRVAPWTLAAPGEAAHRADLSPEDALLAMLNEARRLAGLSPLLPSDALAALARSHAAALRARREITHDTGSGNPTRRVEEAGIPARQVGENVARAPSALRVHRALWASPSHRANLLFPHFDRVGIGVSWEGEAMMYVSILFVDEG